MRDTLLIVTNAVDPHADAVVAECNRRGISVFRLHTGDYPERVSITLRGSGSSISGTISTARRCIDLDRVGFAWLRRPAPPRPDPELPGEVADYVLRQCEATLLTLYAALGDRWLASPLALPGAELKLLQLARAAACGLDVPETVLTNSPQAARDFRQQHGGSLLTKPVRAPARPPRSDEGWRMPMARMWSADVVDRELACSAAIYQPYLEKMRELRCVVIGDQVFSAEVDSQSHPSRPVDVRSLHLDVPYRPHALPDRTAGQLVELVRRFGLSFCSADLVLTSDGRYVFLDLNPNGQWLWLEAPPTNLPLTATLVDLFARHLAGPGSSATTSPALSPCQRPGPAGAPADTAERTGADSRPNAVTGPDAAATPPGPTVDF